MSDWTRSWLFQKSDLACSASMAAIRDFFVSQSKRVSQLQNAFADRLRAIDVLFFHAKLRVTDLDNRQDAKDAKNYANVLFGVWRLGGSSLFGLYCEWNYTVPRGRRRGQTLAAAMPQP
jgi:hypothetical protein